MNVSLLFRSRTSRQRRGGDELPEVREQVSGRFVGGIQAVGIHLFCLTRLSCRSRFHLSPLTPSPGAEPGRETRFSDRTTMKEWLLLL